MFKKKRPLIPAPPQYESEETLEMKRGARSINTSSLDMSELPDLPEASEEQMPLDFPVETEETEPKEIKEDEKWPKFLKFRSDVIKGLEKPETTEKEHTSKEKQIFIKIENFKQIVEAIENISKKLEELEQTLSKLQEVKDKESLEIDTWQQDIETIKQEITSIGENLSNV
jgi:chromosome segregation ATPase